MSAKQDNFAVFMRVLAIVLAVSFFIAPFILITKGDLFPFNVRRTQSRAHARGNLMWAIVQAQEEHFEKYGSYVFTGPDFVTRSEELGIDVRNFRPFRKFRITNPYDDQVIVIEIPDPSNPLDDTLTLYYPFDGVEFVRNGFTAPFYTMGTSSRTLRYHRGI